MKHLVQFSLGIGSAETAYRAVERHGLANVELLTANTKVEDADNWRFGREVWDDLGNPTWTILEDGRTPMQVGRDERCVPNNRLNKDVSILRDRRGGSVTPLPLRTFRERLDRQPELFDTEDWGVCGCMP